MKISKYSYILLWKWSRDFSHQFWITGINFTVDGTIFPTGEVIEK